MSFFSEVLGSIGSGQSPAPPKPAQKPTPTNPAKPAVDATKLASRPAISSSISAQNGTKRKAESDLSGPPDKVVKSTLKPESSDNAHLSVSSASLSTSLPLSNGKRSTPTPGDPKAPGATPKAPPKGSFADIMARARLAQEQKGQTHVGLIMHQAASKEKVSKLAVKRREEDDKAKHVKAKATKPGADNGRIRKRSTSPAKKPNEAKTVKPPRRLLAAPASTYKGTMGQPAQRPRLSAKSRGRDGRRSSKYDEYLGTDEEDEVDDDEVEDEGDISDASSVMEAGALDIDEEERLALKKAQEEDARELALENKLKREKEERRKKLQALADKKR